MQLGRQPGVITRVIELSDLQRPDDLVSAEDDAGRHCFRAVELE